MTTNIASSVRLRCAAYAGGSLFAWLAFHHAFIGAHGSGTLHSLERLWNGAAAVGIRRAYPGDWFIAHQALSVAVPVAAVLYAAVLAALWRQPLPLGELLLWTLAAGLPFLVSPRFQSSDIADYLIRARLQFVYHLNAFQTPASAVPSDPYFRLISWPDIRWSYGPVFLLILAPFARLTTPVAAFVLLRAATFAVHLLNGVLLWRLLDEEGQRRSFFVGAYLLAPLFLLESAGNGHNDFLMALFLLLGFLADRRERVAAASISLALAVLVKMYAAPVLACFVAARLRGGLREAGRALWPAALAIAVFYLPFWVGRETFAGISDGGSSQRVIHSLLSALWAVTGIPEIVAARAGLAVTALAAAAGLVFSARTGRWIDGAAAAMFAWCVAGAGWFWPWYAAAPAVLGLASRQSALRWSSLSLSLTALAFYTHPSGWDDPHGAGAIVPVIVFLVPIGIALRTVTASPGARRPDMSTEAPDSL